jgi:DHA2 family multidrug resistance protein-like MFS transporter
MTGLFMTPWPLAVAFAAPTAGRLSERLPTSWLCVGGSFCLAAGLALSAIWHLQGNLPLLVLFTIIGGVGFGFFQTPNNRNMLLSVPRERSGAAGGMQGTARQVGQTAGAIIMAVIFNLLPLDFAPRIGLATGAALAIAGGLISMLRVGS